MPQSATTRIEKSNTPDFSLNLEGTYGIVCLITKNTTDTNDADYLNLRKVKKESGASIFQLIEYIDSKGICASVSSWNSTEVISSNSLSFSPANTSGVFVVGR